MKKIYSFLIMLILLVTLVPSTVKVYADATTLSAPTNVRWDEDGYFLQLYWDEVENASKYDIELYKNDVLVWTSDVSYCYSSPSLVAQIEENGSGTYTARVKAVGGSEYGDSEWSSLTPSYTYVVPDKELGAPQNVRWDMETKTVYWDVQEGAYYSVRLYYNGKPLAGSTGRFRDGKQDYSGKITQNGTYYVEVQAKSTYINEVRSGSVASMISAEWTDLEDETGKEALAAPANLQWDKSRYFLRLAWDKVDNAENYLLELYKDDVLVYTYNTDYLISSPDLVDMIEARGSGTYTARVKALKTDSYEESEWIYTKEPYIYVMPEAELSVPQNIRWDKKNKTIYWDLEEGAYYNIKLYYNGERILSSTGGYTEGKKDLSSRITEDGIYYVEIQARSTDINKIRSSSAYARSEDAVWPLSDEENDDTEKLNGLCQADDGNWYYYVNGVVQTDFTGLYCDANVGWWLIENGAVNFGYNGLYGDANYGWWLVQDGAISFGYTGLYCDANVGWWLVENGTVSFGYNGLYCDANCGWWLVQGGAISFGYNGLYGDANCGWWLVEGGTISFGYSGLYCDANVGWWLVEGGTISFGYNGLYCDANYGWWLVQGGAISFGYTGLAYDPVVGWWYVTDGAINFGYTGTVEYNGGVFNVVNGMVVF